MIKRNLDLTVLPLDQPLVNIYAGWQQSYHFAFYYQSSNISTIGAQGTNRLGVSIGLDSNGNAVVNNLTPWGYYTSYSQRATSKWAAKATVLQDTVSLNTCILAIEFAYKFQDYQGKNLLTYNTAPYFDGRLPTFATAITSNSALQQYGDMSFFLADLQHCLNILNSSSWFTGSAACASFRVRLAALMPYIKVSVDWLSDPTPLPSGMTKWQTLLQNDSVAPNRISQHGTAYYGMGVIFNSPYLLNLGKYLIQYALKYQINTYNDAVRSPAGIITKTGVGPYSTMAWARTTAYLQAAPLGWSWFAEQGGSDSSYNGTNILNLLKIYPVIQSGDASFKKQVWTAITKSIQWQLRMLMNNGQFSQQDNTRVYSGGETYNGKPKQNDYFECLFDFEFYATLTGDVSVRAACDLMMHYYSSKTFSTYADMFLYSFGRNEIFNGDIDLVNDDLYLGIVQTSGKYNAPYTCNLTSDQYLSQIPPAAFADSIQPVNVNSFVFGDGTLYASPVYYNLVQPMPSLVQIGGIVLFKYTGDPTTSTLIAYGDNTVVAGLPYGPQGVDIYIQFRNGTTNTRVFNIFTS